MSNKLYRLDSHLVYFEIQPSLQMKLTSHYIYLVNLTKFDNINKKKKKSHDRAHSYY